MKKYDSYESYIPNRYIYVDNLSVLTNSITGLTNSTTGKTFYTLKINNDNDSNLKDIPKPKISLDWNVK